MSDKPVNTGEAGSVEPEPADLRATAALPEISPPEGDATTSAEAKSGDNVVIEPTAMTAPSVDESNAEASEIDTADSPVAESGVSVDERVGDVAAVMTEHVGAAGGTAESESEEDEGDDGAEVEPVGDVEPLEMIEDDEEEGEVKRDWYILKVQVNRETTIRDALQRRVKIAGLERFFGEIIVPTEDVVEFTKSGKKRTVKRKLYPGYIVVDMAINDDTWFLVRETPGIGDFTGSAGKPTPMLPHEVERIVKQPGDEEEEGPKRMAIPFKPGDRVRVKEGYFQNFEGDVETVDEANGRITVMINIFGRSTPVELEHWQVEAV